MSSAPRLAALLMIASSPAAAITTALDLAPSVRAVGMGEAGAASDDDVFGLHYNPAAGLKMRQAAVSFQRGALDESFGAFGFGLPYKGAVVAANLSYFDGGSIELENTSGTRRSVAAQRDILASAAASLPLHHALSVGGGAKLLHSELLGEFKTNAILFDAGAMFRPTTELSLGAAVQNMGNPLNYAGRAEDAPREFRGGLAYKHPFGAHRITLAFDQVLDDSFGEPREHLGAELAYAGLLALRVGYKVGYDETLSFGFGLTRDPFTFDFAMLPGSALSSPIKVALTGRF